MSAVGLVDETYADALVHPAVGFKEQGMRAKEHEAHLTSAWWQERRRDVATRVMSKMGWKPGEGMGSRKQGITACLQAPILGRRVGLGYRPNASSMPASARGDVELPGTQDGPSLSTFKFAGKRRHELIDPSASMPLWSTDAPYQRLKQHRPEKPHVTTLFDHPNLDPRRRGEALLHWQRQQREALGSFRLPPDPEATHEASARFAATETGATLT
jgi:hypothetical protein